MSLSIKICKAVRNVVFLITIISIITKCTTHNRKDDSTSSQQDTKSNESELISPDTLQKNMYSSQGTSTSNDTTINKRNRKVSFTLLDSQRYLFSLGYSLVDSNKIGYHSEKIYYNYHLGPPSIYVYNDYVFYPG